MEGETKLDKEMCQAIDFDDYLDRRSHKVVGFDRLTSHTKCDGGPVPLGSGPPGLYGVEERSGLVCEGDPFTVASQHSLPEKTGCSKK